MDDIDTSALVKLVVAEAETSALRQCLDDRTTDPVAGDLARVELLRAVRRVDPQSVPRARQVLDSITLIRLTSGLFDERVESTRSTSEASMLSTWPPLSTSATNSSRSSPTTSDSPTRRHIRA